MLGKIKKGFSLMLICVMLLTSMPGAMSAPGGGVPIPFTDVGTSHWARSTIRFVYARGLMRGTSETTFSPDDTFTRAQVVATLFRVHFERTANMSDPRDNNFIDVPESEWFAPYVTWASAKGIVNGIGDNQFAPDENVDRQHLAMMLYRFADALTNIDTTVRQGVYWNDFADRSQIESWAVDGLTWANYQGIIIGRTETMLDPTGVASRAEAAIMLMRFLRAKWNAGFLLTVSVDETTLPQGEHFRVNIELKNNSGKNHEITTWSLFDLRIPGYHPIYPGLRPPLAFVDFFENGSTISRSFYLIPHRELSQGVHQLTVSASFQFGFERPADSEYNRIPWEYLLDAPRVNITPNTIVLTVQ